MLAKSKFVHTVALALLLLLLLLAAAVPLASQLAWAEDGLSAGGASELQGQAKTQDYEFEDGAIRIYGVKSGKVTYSEKSKTLTLSNAAFDNMDLNSCEKLTVKLVGKNTASAYFIGGHGSNATIVGTGSATGRIYGLENLTMNSGTLTASANASDGRTYGVYCTNLTVSDGNLKTAANSNDSNAYGVSCSGDVNVKGGNLTATAKSSDDSAYGVSCSGDVNVSGGQVSVTKNSGKEGVAERMRWEGYLLRGADDQEGFYPDRRPARRQRVL